MASWVTPITDWDGVTTSPSNRKYYNPHVDLDRVEENTEYLKDEFASIGYGASTTTFKYSRTRLSFDHYASDLNRIENNILAIKNATWDPISWTTPITNWASVSQDFTYVDANRLEQNLLYLYNMLNNIKDAYLECGNVQSICGKGNTLF